MQVQSEEVAEWRKLIDLRYFEGRIPDGGDGMRKEMRERISEFEA